MANPTFVQIATQTLATNTATVTFSGIPQTYTDLLVKMSARGSGSGSFYDNATLTFNGVTTGYTTTRFTNQQAASIGTDTISNNTFFYIGEIDGNTATANVFGVIDFYIANYSGTTYKSISSENASENNTNGSFYNGLHSQLWASYTPITSITLGTTGGGYVTNSEFTLYGIKNY
jgi:hypothetical protein